MFTLSHSMLTKAHEVGYEYFLDLIDVGNWVSRKLNDFPRDSELESGGAGPEASSLTTFYALPCCLTAPK